MKKHFYTLLLLCLVLPFSNFAQQQFGELAMVRPEQQSTLPSFVKFKSQSEVPLELLESWLRANYELNTSSTFELIRAEPDHLGHIHYRYQQLYDGIPIADAIWIVHTKNGKIYSMNGLVFRELQTKKQDLDETSALDLAKSFVGASLYKWEIPGEEEHLRWEKNDPEATYFPKGELTYVAKVGDTNPRNMRLAFKFNIYAQQPLYRAEIYVDAENGDIIRENKLIHHVDEPGIGVTAYSGEQDIIADSFGDEYRLRDGSRGDGIRTFDLNNGTDYGAAVDFIDDDNYWDLAGPELNEYALDAHWGSEMTYDYFFLEHGRNSIDNDGFQLNSYVHYSTGFVNAFWDGDRMTYGDGDGAGYSPLTTLDIAGHEITHGLTEFSAGLIYSGESGALNESFSDIFGNSVERFARPDDYSWLLGEEIGTAIRSMAEPNMHSNPDTYGGDFWTDGGGVHTNSGVQNHWFYILTEGDVGTNDLGDDYDVEGIGIEASAAIAFRNLTVYLTPSSNYADARFYAIQAAVDLYGGCSFEVAQTTNAWYAVGIGEPYSDEVIANFTVDIDEGCEVPFTVSFSNASVNGVDFIWDFGDGETSTDLNPTHTYTAEGTYSVSLYADGDVCGEDDTIIVDMIVIDTDLDCPVIMPTSGTETTQNSCTGKLYDSGGPTGNYGNTESSQITIAPTDAETVTLEFISFDVETGPSCSYDNLRVYDGPDAFSPLIGSYCNSSPPPSTIESTEGSITIVFSSDWVVNNAGFEIDWTCTQPVDNTGIEDNPVSNGISIFPNPTQGHLMINSIYELDVNVEIYDMTGRKLLAYPISGKTNELQLKNWDARGIYILTIIGQDGEAIKTERIVVQ